MSTSPNASTMTALIAAASILFGTGGAANAVPRLHSIGVHSVNGFHDIDINIYLDREDIVTLTHPVTQAKIATLLTGLYGPYGTYAAVYIAQRSADIERASHGNNASVKFSIRTLGPGYPQGVTNWNVGGCEARC